MELSDIFFVCTLLLKLFTLYFVVVALFTLGRLPSFPRTAPRTRFAILVAARNEEAVIRDLARSVFAQDYPRDLYDLFVAPNNCTDGTEEAAREAGASIFACTGRITGKGEVLRQACARLGSEGYDAFLVLDADNTLAPDYLSRMNDAFQAGARVCKSRTRTANPCASAVSGCYGLYNASFDLIWNRPRAVCGLSAKLIGTGFAVRRDVLEELGGWNTETIAEDAEFASQLAEAGCRVVWVPEAVNYDEAPTDFLVSLRQRRRWCSGVMQVARRRLGAMWSRPCSSPILRWDMTMFLLTPFAQAVSALLLGTCLVLRLCGGDFRGLLLFFCSLLVSWATSLGAGAFLSLSGGYGIAGMGKAIVLFPFFIASWMPLQVLSLFCDTKRWQPIPHRGVAAGCVRGRRALRPEASAEL